MPVPTPDFLYTFYILSIYIVYRNIFEVYKKLGKRIFKVWTWYEPDMYQI